MSPLLGAKGQQISHAASVHSSRNVMEKINELPHHFETEHLPPSAPIANTKQHSHATSPASRLALLPTPVPTFYLSKCQQHRDNNTHLYTNQHMPSAQQRELPPLPAPSRKRCVVNGQMAKASNTSERPPLPPLHTTRTQRATERELLPKALTSTAKNQNLSFRFRPVNLLSSRTSLPCRRCWSFLAKTQLRLLATFPFFAFPRGPRLSLLPAWRFDFNITKNARRWSDQEGNSYHTSNAP